MALFGKKKKEDRVPVKEAEVQAKENEAPKISKGVRASGLNSSLLIRPRVTEKATELGTNKNVYVFEVPRSVSKPQIKKVIFDLYKVSPVKIATVKIPEKKFFIRGKSGKRGAGKKVYVYLKKEDKLEIM